MNPQPLFAYFYKIVLAHKNLGQGGHQKTYIKEAEM
jgi:hypothetical protein